MKMMHRQWLHQLLSLVSGYLGLALLFVLSSFPVLANPALQPEFSAALRAFDAREFDIAKRLFEACAESGDPGALNNIAVILLISQKETAVAEAQTLLERDVANGLTIAKYNLAILHGMQNAETLYISRMSEAADDGYLPAMVNVAIMTMKSPHTSLNEGRKARVAIENAAIQGNHLAQYTFGILSEFGMFGEKRQEAAIFWYNKARAGGISQAKIRLNGLRSAGQSHRAVDEKSGFILDSTFVIERRTTSVAAAEPGLSDEGRNAPALERINEHRPRNEAYSASEMSGNFSIRYSHSLSGQDVPITNEMQAIGAMVELRKGPLSGARVYADYFPRVETDSPGLAQYCEWSRMLLGWAIEVEINSPINKIHLIPKFGSYSLSANVPGTDAGGKDSSVALETRNEPALGLEFDAEMSRYGYIIRGSASRDIPFRSGAEAQKRGGKVESSRIGADLFLRGPDLSGGRWNLSYLAFLARERVKVSSSEAASASFELDLPLMGLGAGLSW